MQGTLAREHVRTEGLLAREHVSTQATLARDHVSTQGTLAREHVRHAIWQTPVKFVYTYFFTDYSMSYLQ